MVREIVHLQVGQCGNQIGNVFWKTIGEEHHLDNTGRFEGNMKDKNSDEYLDKINVYYHQSGKKTYVPRAILVDLEPGTMDVIKASPIGKQFKQDNFIFGASGAGNNWAKGHYTDGAEFADEILGVLRKEMEACDAPQGIQMTHSLGGGTGSGLGTLMLLKLRDVYPDRILSSYSVYPSPKVSDVVVEPYNAMLAIHQLLECTDLTFCIDNEALYNISNNLLKQVKPGYAALNWVISLCMSGITCSLRFSGQLNGDLRKMGVNLVPFPRLHFFTIAEAPLFSQENAKKMNITVRELSDQLWSPKNVLCNIKTSNGKYFAAACIYRGKNLKTQEIDDQVSQIQQKMSDDFIDWIPNNIKTNVINTPPKHIPLSATFVGNTTAIKGVLKRIQKQFLKLYKKKAFLHWYKGEGMDELEFQEADKNIKDLITEYQDKQDAVADIGDNANADAEEDDE